MPCPSQLNRKTTSYAPDEGVEYDAESQTWRGYIEANGSTRKLLTEATFEDKGEAIVAASNMLREARKGTVPGFAH